MIKDVHVPVDYHSRLTEIVLRAVLSPILVFARICTSRTKERKKSMFKRKHVKDFPGMQVCIVTRTIVYRLWKRSPIDEFFILISVNITLLKAVMDERLSQYIFQH